jgi:hypothetical protein
MYAATRFIHSLFFLIIAQATAACGGSSPDDCDSRIEVPAGFCAKLFADGVGPVRHLAVDKSGRLYAGVWRESQSGGGIARFPFA